LMPGEATVETLIVGDVMLGRGVVWQADPLAAVTPWLRSADLTVGNLEGVITTGAPPPQAEPDLIPPYSLLMPITAVTALQDAGFDLLNLANNHVLDGGGAGLAESVAYLQDTGITPFGLVGTDASIPQPVIRDVRGVRLAFLGFNRVSYGSPSAADSLRPAEWDRVGAAAAIESARAQADAVIVSVHWGHEYELRASQEQRILAQAMVDAGATLVVGHHPHVVQEIGTLTPQPAHSTGQQTAATDAFVAYSLGNFVFDQQFDETRYGLALRAFFDHNGLRAVQVLPVNAGPRPQLMPPAEAGPLLARLEITPLPVTNQTLFQCPLPAAWTAVSREEAGCWPVDVAGSVAATGGVFRSGTIDLTGDGRAEEVQLADGQVGIYAPSDMAAPPLRKRGTSAHTGSRQELWRSPPEWQVGDVALGDPNDDGRGELMLAMWKPDASDVPPSVSSGQALSPCSPLQVSGQGNGILRSHPFVIGYREGIYRALWGGSAVVRPLREIELGDVNGDRVQELIVLEDDGAAGSRVAVWRWHGWGFSLMWRSPPGRYHDLQLMPGPAGRVYIVLTSDP
jgi:poly-gamma-glutamate capsule biosynthesis protein CapA/YwtB (metallophosphatase superfamily)